MQIFSRFLKENILIQNLKKIFSSKNLHKDFRRMRSRENFTDVAGFFGFSLKRFNIAISCYALFILISSKISQIFFSSSLVCSSSVLLYIYIERLDLYPFFS